jgi:hypothetical protein
VNADAQAARLAETINDWREAAQAEQDAATAAARAADSAELAAWRLQAALDAASYALAAVLRAAGLAADQAERAVEGFGAALLDGADLGADDATRE